MDKMDKDKLLSAADPNSDMDLSDILKIAGVEKPKDPYDIDVRGKLDPAELKSIKDSLTYGTTSKYSTEELAEIATRLGIDISDILNHPYKRYIRMRLINILRLVLLKRISKTGVSNNQLIQIASILNIPIENKNSLDRKALIKEIKGKLQ